MSISKVEKDNRLSLRINVVLALLTPIFMAACLIVVGTIFGCLVNPNSCTDLSQKIYEDFSSGTNSAFIQGVMGASYGALGAFTAITWIQNQKERNVSTILLIKEISSPGFIKTRREATAFLTSYQIINENGRPYEWVRYSLSEVFYSDLWDKRDQDAIASLRSVLSMLELLGNLANSDDIDARKLKVHCSGFLENWLTLFRIMAEEEIETNGYKAWPHTIANLNRALSAFGYTHQVRAPR